MDFITGAVNGVWSYVIVFLAVLTIVVFIHELGHFLVARWCGVKVTAFSIGFGPELFGFTDRHDTRWRFALIPLGGYVKFMDDENAASMPSSEAAKRMTPEERAGSFHAKPLWQRAAVVAAGPIANFILAAAIFSAINMAVGVRSTAARVDEVVADMPAAKAGFKPGDVITAIDGWTIESFDDVLRVVSTSGDKELTFQVQRGNDKHFLKVTPVIQDQKDAFGGTYRRGLIGIKRATTPQNIEVRHVGPIEAVRLGIRETWTTITSTVAGISDIITGRQSADQMGGPVLMAEVTAKVAELGIEPMLRWVAFVSASIGFLNLLPIPVLDGGHLLFYAIEAVRRKPLNERMQEVGFRIGIALVLMLMIYVNLNDLMRVWRRMTGTG